MLIDDLLYALPNDKDERATILATALSIAIRFQVDNVAQYVHEDGDKRRVYHIEDHIPNIAPLAPYMWFEYGGLAVGKPALQRFGCYISIDYGRDENYRTSKWYDIELPDRARWILRAEYFCTKPEGIGASDYIYLVEVGDNGEVLGTRGPIPSHRGDFKPDESQRDVWHEEIIVAFMAICFAHCKGTQIEEHQPTRQVRRAAERTGKPVFTFHTIDIHPATQVLRTEGKISENGLAKALHICRGHFAHYTAEKPLFGKYTGTFYRPMHVRGKAEQGTVIKDYRVHAEVAR